jgi:hypothetical protein
LGLDDLDPEEVAEFLTKFGMVGLGNYSRRAALNQISNPRDFIQSVGISEKYLPVIEKEFESDPRSLRKRISKIYNGDEIPFKWIEDDLRTLARCIRLIVALDQNSKDWWKKGEIVFKRDKNLRRIIHAWSPIFAIPDYKDPGQYLPTNSKWLHINPNNILEDFVSKINRFLLPISQNAVLTKKLREIQDRNFGLETALSSYLFLNKTKGLYQITCKYEKCGKLHFPERNTKVFCSTTCGTNDRVSRKRERDKNKKKVSAAKAGSKATPKARKEKK